MEKRSNEDILLARLCEEEKMEYRDVTDKQAANILMNHGLIDMREASLARKYFYVPTQKGVEAYRDGGFDKYKERLNYPELEHKAKMELIQLGIETLKDLPSQTKKAETSARKAHKVAIASVLIAFASLLLQNLGFLWNLLCGVWHSLILLFLQES